MLGVFCSVLVGILIGGLCLWNWKSIRISLKTSKRDLRGARVFVQTQWKLFWAKRRNLTVHRQFAATAKKHAHKVCFYFEEEEWTFGEVEGMANRVGNFFAAQGFAKGDTLAIFMENGPEYFCLWLGLAKVGVVSALINTNLRLHALEHCLNAANCKAIIYGHELASRVEELVEDETSKVRSCGLYVLRRRARNEDGEESVDAPCPAVDLRRGLQESSEEVVVERGLGFHDNLFYIYTSGTTGLPKAAIIKHSRYFMIAIGSRSIHGIRVEDVVYTPLPLYHSAANILAAGHALLFGSSLLFRKKFSASAFWRDCIRHNVTAFQYIGEICRYLVAQPPTPEDTQHQVRVMFGNGLRADLWAEFLHRFKIPEIREFYGSTEGNCNLGSCDNQVGAVGFIPRFIRNSSLFPLVLIQLEQGTGEPMRDPKTGLVLPCPFNVPGELVGVIKEGNPLTEFQGYTDDNCGESKMVRDVRVKGDAGFRSGDILMMDECGYVYFKDRQGDTFRWKGENVSTAEVEAIVSRAAGLRDTAVYGVAIPGVEGKAGMASILDPSETLDLEALSAQLTTLLPAYARPLFIRTLKHMDMTGTFKLKKGRLQDEGFDVRRVSESLYFCLKGKYVPLEEALFRDIMDGKVRV